MPKVSLPKIRIYSDGSAKAQDGGSGGYGTIVKYMSNDNKTIRIEEFSEGFKITTNNRMELMGVIIGLESLKEPCEVMIYSDSKYVVDAFNKDWIIGWQNNGWKTVGNTPVKNQDLWERLLLAKKPHTCKFAWLRGHNGHVDNERCDYLAQSSASGVKFIKDENGKLIEDKTTEKIVSVKSGPITLKDVFRTYIATTKKNYTLKLNGVELIIDEDGDVFPCPGEDIKRTKDVLKLLKQINEDETFVGLFKNILLENKFGTLFSSNTLSDLSRFIFTHDDTIPKFQIILGNDK